MFAGQLIPRLPQAAVIVLVGDAVSALGQGMTLPFLLVYLHEVRGLSLSAAGLVLSTVAVTSLIGNPLGGWLSDPLGPRITLAISLLFSAVGVAGFAVVADAPTAFAAAGLLGIGNAIAWPAFDALLAVLVPPERRPAAFSVRHATLNSGLALGAVTAGLIVDPTHVGTFQAVFIADAVTFAAFIPLLLLIPAHSPVTAHSGEPTPSYRAVLRDRTFLSVVALSALLVAVGIAQYHAAFPGWATRDDGVPVSALGACFAANAATVVLLQLPMLRLLNGRRRTTAVALSCTLWALTWLLALMSGYAGSGWVARGGFILAMAMFGIAETALAPTLPAIVNDLAPDHLRGRYNGVSALGWTTGFLLGPAISGFALNADAGATLLVALMGGCLVAAVWASHLGRRLPETANQISV